MRSDSVPLMGATTAITSDWAVRIKPAGQENSLPDQEKWHQKIELKIPMWLKPR
jgi:hypothetical protein